MHTCTCGFRFSGAGELRNCGAFISDKGESGVVCPDCNQHYVYEGGIAVAVKIHEGDFGDMPDVVAEKQEEDARDMLEEMKGDNEE